MARDAMPPMVVSSNRYFDIEPYCNRLRESDPVEWGSVFPWEFPQNAEKAQEEAFLRKFFTAQEIHVQGGAGNKGEPGAGYRFLKQVWYTQAIFNWEQRVPAFIDWWLKNAEAAVYIHDPSMRKFILAPEATLTTFFQTEDIQTYGEKFLSQVYPMIQQAARAKIEEQKNGIAKKDASNDQITRTVAQVTKPMHASEPPTAAFEAESDMPGLTKTFSQPTDAKHKMLSPVEARRPAPHSTVPQPAHPRVISNDEPSHTELSTFNRKRGNGGRRFSNRGTLHQSNTPPRLQMSDATGVPPYRTVSGMSMNPYQGHPPFNQIQHQDFAPVMGHGPPVGQPPAHFDPAYPFPPPHPVQHPSNFNGPFNGPQPQVFWAPDPLAVQENGLGYHSNLDSGRGKGAAFRGGYEHHHHEFRGDNRNRAFTGDRGRGRGRGRGRNSFGSQGQAPVFVSNRTTHEFKSIDPGFDFATRVRRPSVVSVEKNWRSGSERPQDLLSPGGPENITPPRFAGKYVPAPDVAVHGFAPAFQRLNQAPKPPHAAQHVQTGFEPIDDPRSHCSQHAIGDLCRYATKLTVFNIPIEVNEHEVINFFQQFGTVQSFGRPSHPNQRPPRDYYMGFICFDTADAARNCLMNCPETWLADNRPLRVEVPKEYWDSNHKKYRMHKNSVIPSAAPMPQPSPAVHAGKKDGVAAHRSQESSSTKRGPAANTPEPPSGSEERTPTASGTSTPKKKGKPNNKGKSRKGKGDDADENSLAASKPPKSKLELNTDEITRAPNDAPSTNGSTPTAEIDKLRSASEVTERQTASEPSDTPVDKVVAKLPVPDGKGDKAQTPTTSAANVVFDATLEEPRKDVDLQAAAEPPSTVFEPASENTPSDANPPDQLFREGEAKKATSPETFMTGTGGAQKELDIIATDVAATPAKAEEEHVDDSFHTATGSPSTPKDHTHKDGHQAATDVKETATSSTQSALDDGSATSHLDKKTSEAQQTIATVDDKQTSNTTSLSVDTQPLSKNQQRKLAAAKRSASSGGSLNPPQEFVTAPNTPYIEQESDKQAATEDATGPPSNKVEKKKGPAETESLSLFGKKQQKKPKQPKKGTLKGKPKSMPDAAGATSDASPYPSKPPSEAPDAPIAERKAGNESDSRSQPEKQLPPSVKQSSVAAKGNDPSVPNPVATPDDLGGTLPPTADEPAKHRGSIFNIGRYFTSQTSQSNPREKQDTSSQSTKSSLTDVKAPANDPEQGDLAKKQGSDTKPHSSVSGAVKSIEADADGVPDANSVEANSSRTIAGYAGSDRDAGNTGLGIMNIDGADEKSGSTSKKKRKPKKKKNKKKETAEGLDELTPEGTPEPEGASTSQQPFRSNPDFNFSLDTPGSIRSDRSDSSPRVFGVATPSTGTSSPTVSKQPRKLPSSMGKGIVEEKIPKWKNKKRLHRGAGGTDESVNSSDEENKNYELESVNSNGNTGPFQIQVVDTSSAAGTDNTPRSIVLVPGTRVVLLLPSQNGSNDDEHAGDAATSNRIEDVTDDIVEVNEVLQDSEKGGAEGKAKDGSSGDGAENTTVKEGKKKMQLLLEQESSRKYGKKDISAVEVERERMTGEDKAKVEAARKLHPGRPIVFAQLIDESSEDD